MSIKEKLVTLPQYLLPHHLLSRLLGYLMECKQPFIKNLVIKFFIRTYKVNMGEAIKSNPEDYVNFNEFFTRLLKPTARNIVAGSDEIACPIDGSISQISQIQDDRIFQAKGHYFNLNELLGGNEARAKPFINGSFTTLYLSPKDYHRIHMPIAGKLIEMVHIPGKLFSVNPRTTRHVEQLFARNERVACIFETEAGPMAVILVGAFFVASISTVWAGTITPPQRKKVQAWQYNKDHSITLSKGDELGQFKLGSTVILLFAKDKMKWNDSLQADHHVQLGELLGKTLNF